MTTRRADKAGSWYCGDEAGLREEVGKCLAGAERDFGRAIPEDSAKPVAVVVPHAGLAYSGPIAAAAYRLIQDVFDFVDTFVVFGACHRMRLARPAIWAEGEWETPLGGIRVDAELARALAAAGVGEMNEPPHIGDNAIELQTPFIRCMFPDAMIVPIAMSAFADSWKFGELASRISEKAGKRVVAVASTDLTHYGAAFGVMPAGTGEPAVKWTRKNDQIFLKALLGMNLENIVAVATRDNSACGAGAAAAAAGWAKARGSREGKLLAHVNSYEVAPDGKADHMVGYASVAFLGRIKSLVY